MCNISENLNTCENGEIISPFTLYREQKRSGSYPALNLEEKCYPLDQGLTLDAKDIAPPDIINDASQIPKRQKP